MKKIVYLFVFCLMTICIYGQDYYMYVNGERHYYNASSTKMFIRLDNNADLNSIKTAMQKEFSAQDVKIENINANLMLVDMKDASKTRSIELMKQWNRKEQIKYASPVLLDRNETEIGCITNQILVRLKQTDDYPLLLKSVKPYNITDIKSCEFDKRTYLMTIDNAMQKNAMQIANELYESGLFEYAEPNLLHVIQLSTNDQYYLQQWALSNTGQNGGTSGIDIKANLAWGITTGSPNIRIAVLDIGVDLNHPDLVNRLLPGFDATGNGSNGAPINNTGDDHAHGTACSGIVAAQGNNSVGIAGVAHNCRILPVRIATRNGDWTITESQYIASGINWAVQNNARVMSMSFGCIETTALNTAIDDAVSSGCVLVAASGNFNTSFVNYPASRPNVIAVGAISQCGTRKRSSSDWRELNPNVQPDPAGVSCDGEKRWGSNYGNALDVVAPGVLIPTTDLQGSAGYNTASGTNGNYYMNFGGTSAACPHVAGIAALILSVRPDLMQPQVRQAIESTCTKINPTIYSYAANANHPNGTWYNQVGHGLVNAYDAVYSVAPRISGPSVICTGTTATYTILNLPAGASVAWDKSSELTLTSGTTGSSLSVTSRPMIFGKEEWVQAVITIPGMPANTIRLGGIRLNGYIPIVGPDEIYYDTPKEYYYAEEGAISYSWTSTTMQILSGANTYVCKVRPLSLPGDGMLTCTVVTWCGTYTVNKDIHIIDYSGWFVYPNPSSSIIHLVQEQSQNSMSAVQQTNNARKTASTIVVQLASALSGTIVRSQTVSDFSDNLDMDISNIPNGTYVIAVSKENKIVHRQTIIIQH